MIFSIYNKLFRSLCSAVQSQIIAFGFVIIAIFVALTGARAASPGALDLTYGSRGLASITLSGSSQAYFSNAVVVQPDGKSVITGRTRTCSGATCNEHFSSFALTSTVRRTPILARTAWSLPII